MAIKLGKKSEIFGAEQLRPLSIKKDRQGRPIEIPMFSNKDDRVICGFDQGLGEDLYVCETFADMQELDAAYGRGLALTIHWYTGTISAFVVAVV